jgi:hypothetical protein
LGGGPTGLSSGHARTGTRTWTDRTGTLRLESPGSLITCQMIRITAKVMAKPRAASASTVGTTTRAE